ncbi:hypothetical protein Tco_0681597 [Tanacetum coccineum]|uniref:Tf2-1-like SH3-like domain-containing protein n=1 Tax=Tanacetum coccineum TaxID=301880 RepID=A0ABQ4XNS6_9ASTR
MDVRRIEEEVDPDFLSDAHSRTGPTKSGDSCESKVLEVRGETNRCECEVSFTPQREVEFRMELVQGVTPIAKARVVYTKSKEEHELHLKMNFELLKIEKCHVKPNKVEISKAENTSTKMLRDEAVARHGVHMSSIPDKDGMYIESERTFRTLENMFRACVRNLVVVGILTFREVSFPTKIVIIPVFDEFSLEVLYGRREFSVGDHVMMKVSPWKGVVRFDKKGELAPRYIGPIEILERIDHVAYRLRLPDELSIINYLSGVKISSKPEIALIL